MVARAGPAAVRRALHRRESGAGPRTARTLLRHHGVEHLASLQTDATVVARGARTAIANARVSERRARHQPRANSATNTRSPALAPISAVCRSHAGASCVWSVMSRKSPLSAMSAVTDREGTAGTVTSSDRQVSYWAEDRGGRPVTGMMIRKSCALSGGWDERTLGSLVQFAPWDLCAIRSGRFPPPSTGVGGPYCCPCSPCWRC